MLHSTMTVPAHSEAVHTEKLNSLCRICGERSKKTRECRNAKLCRNYVAEITIYFGIDIADDAAESTTYSSTFCTKCYSRAIRLKSAETPSEISIQSARKCIQRSKHIWTKFDPSIGVDACSVCCTFEKQKKAGRPLNPNRGCRSDKPRVNNTERFKRWTK